jgi:hypothetical protein
LTGNEIRALRRVKREGGAGRYIFKTERNGPMTAAGFRKMLARVGEAAGMTLPVQRTCCGMRPGTSSPT